MKPLTIPSGCHPLVSEFLSILNQKGVCVTKLADEAGLSRGTFYSWRRKSNPSVAILSAALNALGGKLVIEWPDDKQ